MREQIQATEGKLILNLGESYNRINLEKLMKQKELLKSEQAKHD